MAIINEQPYQCRALSEENRVFIQSSLATQIKMGKRCYCVGMPEAVSVPELALLGAKRHHVLGDGSCWARALWQATFSQTLDNSADFRDFVDKVAASSRDCNIPLHLVKDTIQILFKLKLRSAKERINFLNHENIDRTLVLYMRHIAADYMSKHYSFYSKEELKDIRTNMSRYGGPEVTAFAKHFNLAVPVIFHDGHWKYQLQEKGKGYSNSPITVSKLSSEKMIPPFVMFGANNQHFEFLSFDSRFEVGIRALTDAQELAQLNKEWQSYSCLEDSLDELSEQVLRDRSHVRDDSLTIERIRARQIENDFELAQKLQWQEY
ncbi:MAG: hypothetical protein Q8K75_12590 [Chlamydiales bacterium]|nr:hypothetical protein [Chlamydiales bacterium]